MKIPQPGNQPVKW